MFMWRDERGMALVLVLLCAMLFLALGGALVTVVSSEATISATFRESAVALSAADAAIVGVLADLAAAPDLSAILMGTATSSFFDGPAPKRLPDGTTLDLTSVTSRERCGENACTDAQMDAVTAERPWGVNNARWQVYGSGWLRDLTPQAVDVPHVYVVVWAGDDPLEADANPLSDDPSADAPGHDVVLLRAAAFAAYSVRRRIEVVARRANGAVRITSWREIR
jgi:hypothetical protein